jgi:hypothetical protein
MLIVCGILGSFLPAAASWLGIHILYNNAYKLLDLGLH